MAAPSDREATDRDETRRLLYMALAASRTDKYELVGTLVNALVHHQHATGDPNEALDNAIDAVEGHHTGLYWVHARLAALAEDTPAP